MSKIITICFFLISTLTVAAQDLVTFNITPTGNFVSAEGQDFVIVPFEGKNAHQIYQTLASNVGSTFNDPSKVMSGVDDTSIKIRAFCDNLYTNKIMGFSHAWEGYYQLEFRIKDGRVRVSAPIVEDDLHAPSISNKAFGGNNGSFRKIVSKWYKDGKLKEKNEKDALLVESQMNSIINAILGLIGSTQTNDDW